MSLILVLQRLQEQLQATDVLLSLRFKNFLCFYAPFRTALLLPLQCGANHQIRSRLRSMRHSSTILATSHNWLKDFSNTAISLATFQYVFAFIRTFLMSSIPTKKQFIYHAHTASLTCLQICPFSSVEPYLFVRPFIQFHLSRKLF